MEAAGARLHNPEQRNLYTRTIRTLKLHFITTVVTVISSLLPILGLLRTVMDITKQNSSTISEVFPIYFTLFGNILRLFYFCNPVRAHHINMLLPVSSELFYNNHNFASWAGMGNPSVINFPNMVVQISTKFCFHR
jgi:hypothetical protein